MGASLMGQIFNDLASTQISRRSTGRMVFRLYLTLSSSAIAHAKISPDYAYAKHRFGRLISTNMLILYQRRYTIYILVFDRRRHAKLCVYAIMKLTNHLHSCDESTRW